MVLRLGRDDSDRRRAELNAVIEQRIHAARV
jgi:hypothetical protein